jgi:hypothetical protein
VYALDDRWNARMGQSVAAKPTNPQQTPNVPADIWAQLTPVEQAKLWADFHNSQAIIAAQRASSRRTTKILLWVFLWGPLILLAIWLFIAVVQVAAGQ